MLKGGRCEISAEGVGRTHCCGAGGDGLAVRRSAVLCWGGDEAGLLGVRLYWRVRPADGIRSPGYHPSGDRIPAQSPGPAYCGGMAAGTCPGPAVLHPGRCVLTAKQAGGSNPLTSLIL